MANLYDFTFQLTGVKKTKSLWRNYQKPKIKKMLCSIPRKRISN